MMKSGKDDIWQKTKYNWQNLNLIRDSDQDEDKWQKFRKLEDVKMGNFQGNGCLRWNFV
jgi:hypothetical protein